MASDNPRTRSVVPRGFSRFYVLFLLSERPMTGKEIMDETAKRSNGGWKPSPGLVYPLLGKLLAEGLITENNSGTGYILSPLGVKALDDYESSNPGFEHLLVPFMQLGVYGRIVAQDFSDQMISAMKAIRSNISKATAIQRQRYRSFLRAELARLDREDMKKAAS